MRIGLYCATIRADSPLSPGAKRIARIWSYTPLPMGHVDRRGEVITWGGDHPEVILEVPDDCETADELLSKPGMPRPLTPAALFQLVLSKVNPNFRVAPDV